MRVGGPRTGEAGARGAGLLVAGLVVLALANPPRLFAQLVVENPGRKWKAGEVVELIVRGRQVQAGTRIEEVRFDDRPIAFDLVDPGAGDELIRIRIRVPRVIRPGAHRVSVRFSEAPAVPVPPSTSQVPAIVGLSVEQARLELDRVTLGLVVAGEPSSAPAQTVGQQDPPAGASVATGSTVTVEMVVTVPDLVGTRVEEAGPILEDAGLRPRIAFVDPSGGPYRSVVGQDPPAGRSVPPGSPVGLVFERLADLPPPRLPWAWMAVTAALAGLLAQQRVRVRRVRKSFRVRASNDLDGLRKSATPPVWSGPELKLDLRLLGVPDRGRQTLEVEGPLVVVLPVGGLPVGGLPEP